MARVETKMFNRRDLLKAAAGGFVTWHSPAALSVANSIVNKEPGYGPKLVWIILRGAMDSLHAILPLSDPHLMSHRDVLVNRVKESAFDLENGFALHPAFEELFGLYRQKQLLAVLATESGAKSRSHFLAQDFLESGLAVVDAESGWLNRAVEAYRGDSVAVAHTLPIGLRGRQPAKTWYPDLLRPASDDLYARLQKLYSNDEWLSKRLDEGLKSRRLLAKTNPGSNRFSFPALAGSCATILSGPNGPDCAMLEMSGWDTHHNQASRLNRQFAELDQGIAELRKNLGKQWDRTLVLVTTEFGRTVAVNGTGGTDHGTASAMFIAGGAVDGGRVLGRWPGLAESELFEGRDLMPTSDTRQWIRALLGQHWNLSPAQLDHVFPGISTMDTRLIRP